MEIETDIQELQEQVKGEIVLPDNINTPEEIHNWIMQQANNTAVKTDETLNNQ